jgi:inner membrane protein YidH
MVSDDVGQAAATEARDAMRRTHLANERTYLAWWRTGLTALAVSLAIGRIVPELTGGATWPYVSLGAGYAILGIAFIAYAGQRQRAVARAVARGDWAEIDARFLNAIAVIGLVLAIATLVVVLLQP